MANIIPLPQNQGINVPPNSGPTYGLANSIDALFDSYQRAKVQNALLPGQVQSQDLQNQGAQAALDAGRVQMLIGNNGVTNQALGDALQNPGSYAPPTPPVDGGPQSLYAAPTQAAPPGASINQPSPAPQQRQGQAPQMAPGAPTMPQVAPQQSMGAIHGIVSQMGEMKLPPLPAPGDAAGMAKYRLALSHNSMLLQAQEANANLNKTTGEASEANEKARGAKILNDMLAGDSKTPGGVVDQHIKNMLAVNEDPSMSNFGRGDTANAIRTAVSTEIARRGINMSDAQAAWDAKQEAAKSKAASTAKVQGGDTQQIGTIAGVVEDTIDSAAPLIKSLNTDKLDAVNKGFLAGKKALNDPQSTALLTKLNILTNRYAVVSAYPNAPNKDQYDEARKLISDGLTSGSFSAMGDAMKQEGKSIVTRAGGKGYSEPNPNQTGSIQVGKYKVTAH